MRLRRDPAFHVPFRRIDLNGWSGANSVETDGVDLYLRDKRIRRFEDTRNLDRFRCSKAESRVLVFGEARAKLLIEISRVHKTFY